MSAKVHIHVHVSDLARSRDFYRKLFGAPVKEKTGYAKFLPDFAPVNLALSEGREVLPGAVGHFGIQVDSPAGLMAQLDRVKASGLTVREQMGVDCCHANQDKFWVTDPDGVEWEVYHLNYDLEHEEAPTAAGASRPVVTSEGLSLAKTDSCCAPQCCAPQAEAMLG